MPLLEPKIPVSETVILKMDTVNSKAVIRYKLSKVEPSCGDTLLSLYHMGYGYPVSVAEWDIVVPEDEITLDLKRFPLPKATYFVRIKGMVPDEKTGDQKEVQVNDIRVSDAKTATCVKFDPSVKKVAIPELFSKVEVIPK